MIKNFNGKALSSIIKSSFAVSFFSLLNVVFLFVLEMFLARFFGTSIEMDCYLAAVSLPDLFVTVAILGFNYALIPTLVAKLNSDEPQLAFQILNSWLNLSIIILVTIGLMGTLFSNQLVKLFFPGFSIDKVNLTADLLKMYFPVLVFKSSATMLSSIYFARQKFFLAPLVPVIGSICALTLLLIFVQEVGIYIAPVAISISSLIQFLILVGVYLFQGNYRFEIRWNDTDFKLIGKLMLPLIIGGIFTNSIFLVDRNIASNLDAGAISTLGYATKIIRVVLLIGLGGLSVVALPKVSELIAIKDYNQLQNLNRKALSGILFVSTLFYIILFNFGEQLISVLFQYGSFSSADSRNVANTIIFYGGYLIFGALGTHLSILFYAIPDTKTPVIIGISVFIVGYILKIWFSSFMGYKGIALATTIYYALSILLTIFFIQKKEIKFFSLKELLIDFSKFLVIGVIFMILNLVFQSMFSNFDLISLFIGVIVTIFGFIFFSFLLKIELSSIKLVKRLREGLSNEL